MRTFRKTEPRWIHNEIDRYGPIPLMIRTPVGYGDAKTGKDRLMSTVRTPGGAPGKSFGTRVRYAAKCLEQGRRSPAFDACFAEADAFHVAAVLVRRAEKNPKLKRAIKESFGVTRWDDVPWTRNIRRFSGMTSRAIGRDAERVLAEVERLMGEGLVTGLVTGA